MTSLGLNMGLRRRRAPSGGGGGPTYGDTVSFSVNDQSVVSTADSIGAVAAVNWDTKSGFPNWSATNMEDQTAAATTTDCTQAGASGKMTTRATDGGTGMFDVMTRGMGVAIDTGAGTTWAFTQIPYSKYDVFVYFDEDSTSAASVSCTIDDGVTTHNLTDTSQIARFTGTLLEDTGSNDGNYVRFDALTTASVTITAKASTANEFVVTGFQIVERTD